jgi:uracil-DNA glycosylase
VSFSPHFCRGRIPLAFVFSAPGEKEMLAGKPVAGETGTNLELALSHLHCSLPTIFPSSHRYDYRITNAISTPTAIALGHRTSEAPDTEIRAPSNVRRVLRELEGCGLVVLCGNKAKVLAPALRESRKSIIEVPHVGNKALNGKFKVPDCLRLNSSRARREHRVWLWADAVVRAIAGEDAGMRA